MNLAAIEITNLGDNSFELIRSIAVPVFLCVAMGLGVAAALSRSLLAAVMAAGLLAFTSTMVLTPTMWADIGESAGEVITKGAPAPAPAPAEAGGTPSRPLR